MPEFTESTPRPHPDGPFIEVGIGITLRMIPDQNAKTNPPGAASHEILITRRPGHTVYGGWWELPGGKIEPAETVEACVRRELLEEVGVEVEVLATLGEVRHTYEYGTVRLHPRICRLTAESPEPKALHVDAWKWCTLREIEDHKFLPANDAVMMLLSGWLATHRA